MNMNVFYIRMYGRLYPISKCDLVQVNPNTGAIVTDLPMEQPLVALMEYNLSAFARVIDSRDEFNEVHN